MKNASSVIHSEAGSSSGSKNQNPVSFREIAITNAKGYLGYGFANGKKGYQALAITESDIHMFNPERIQKRAFRAEEHDVLKEVRKSLGISLEGAVPTIPAAVNASASFFNASENYKVANKIVCSYLDIHKIKCEITGKEPKLLSNIQIGDDLNGLDYIRSVSISIGYQIDVVIVTGQSKKETGKSAGGNLGLSAFTAKFDAGGKDLEHTLKDQNDVNISLEIKVFGEYPLPDIGSTLNLDYTTVSEKMDIIARDFSEKLPFLKQRSVYFDPDKDCELYSENQWGTTSIVSDITTIPMLNSYRMNKNMVSQQSEATYRIGRDLDSLAKEINRHLSRPEKRVLSTTDLPLILKQIEEVFTPMLSEYEKSTAKERILVLGKTGSGKSLLIGHQLGHKLLYTDDRGKRVLDYETKSSTQPIIGHMGSKTKGCFLYTNETNPFEYIDCAGMEDISGVTAELCNTMAISMMIKIKPPAAAMIVTSSAAITENRGIAFISSIDALRRGLRNLTERETWPSIIFVINDKEEKAHYDKSLNSHRLSTPEETKQRVILEIKRTIEILQDVCTDVKLLPNEGDVALLKQVFTWLAEPTGLIDKRSELAEISKKLDSHVGEGILSTIRGHLQAMELMQLLLNNDQNLIVANLPSPKTKVLIDKRLENLQNTHLSADAFTVEHLYTSTSPELTFQTVLSAVASCFNQVVANKDSYVELSESLSQAINDCLEQLNNYTEIQERLQKGSSNLDSIQNNFNHRIESIKLRLNENKRKQDDLREDIMKNSAVISRLSASSRPMALPALMPNNAIPRHWLSITDANAPRYTFNYESGIPILHVDKITPNGCGKFLDDTERLDMDAGTFTISYLPAWYDKPEDRNAKVIISVEEKNHPHTIQRVRELKSINANKDDQVKSIDSNNDELNVKIQSLTKLNDFAKNKKNKKTTLLEEIQKNIELCIKEKVALEQELHVVKGKIKEMEDELGSHAIFCNLIAKVSKVFRLNTSDAESTKGIFEPFVSRFFIPENKSSLGKKNRV